MLVACLSMAAGCGKSSTGPQESDLCTKTVNHLMSLMSGADQGVPMRQGERIAAGLAGAASIASCRQEGLSQAQADCILGASNTEQLMAMGSCAAIREKKPSWLMLPPTPDELAQLQEQMRSPDGSAPPEAPRTGPVRYRQIAGSDESTCGLRDDGTLQCWGSRTKVPSGSFRKIGYGWHLCGLDRKGRLACASTISVDDLSYLPKDPLSDFAEGFFHGCGVKARDGALICWSIDAEHAMTPPAGAFVEVVSGVDYSCARAGDGTVRCFGSEAPTAPTESFTALAGGARTVCGLRTERRAVVLDRRPVRHGEAAGREVQARELRAQPLLRDSRRRHARVLGRRR